MIFRGELRKMPVALSDESSVEYRLLLHNSVTQEQHQIELNEMVGKKISIQFDGNIYCIICGRKTKTSFAQGFCFPCFKKSPENSECIIRPELCKAHLGEGRDAAWEEKHHNQPHYVYLAATNRIKVGVTRDHQIPVRWIDQGASSAIKLAKTPNRYLAGMIEVALKETFVDKTDWRSMLRNELDHTIDLLETKENLEELLPADIVNYICDENEITHLKYPVIEYPEKIKTINLDKDHTFEGKLVGIKGQYLMFENSTVMNVRKYAGYEITFTVEA